MTLLRTQGFRKVAMLGTILILAGYGAVALHRKPPSTIDRSYWIWNINDLSYADSSSELILYQGNVDSNWEFHHRGLRAYPLPQSGPVTLLFRLYRLGPPEDIAVHYLSVKRRWARYGTKVNGLQIDYDSPSGRLAEYRRWLHTLREHLPGEPVSITALAAYVFDVPEVFLRLSEEADYLAVQLYRGYAPHEDFRAVVRFLRESAIRHRVGITLSPEFPRDSELCGRHCLGVSIFLNKGSRRL